MGTGNRQKRRRREWLDDSAMQEMWQAGHSLLEIALANEAATGWKPTRSTVSKHLKELGEPSRYSSRKDLKPWIIAREHQDMRYRFWLDAESRRRAGYKLTASENRCIDLMNDLLHGRGAELVIGYCENHGFYLTDRLPGDDDIIRIEGETEPHGNSDTA